MDKKRSIHVDFAKSLLMLFLFNEYTLTSPRKSTPVFPKQKKTLRTVKKDIIIEWTYIFVFCQGTVGLDLSNGRGAPNALRNSSLERGIESVIEWTLSWRKKPLHFLPLHAAPSDESPLEHMWTRLILWIDHSEQKGDRGFCTRNEEASDVLLGAFPR